MNYKDDIIKSIADEECIKIRTAVIVSLLKMKDCKQSGEDSPLENLWEEVCVQVQGEYSIFWEMYLDLIYSLILNELEKISKLKQVAIWLQTNGGQDWKWELENEETVAEFPPHNTQEITEYILDEYVLSEADRTTNERIEAYMD
ncbi:MAG: hypothetical protein AB1599_10235 [Planctomycetota bacterium]